MKNFITFEGLDGSGKTTQANFLADYFEKNGENVLFVREPGSTPLGEILRDAVLKQQDIAISPQAEALIFAAARAQLTENLKENYGKKTIICDRFLDSSIAYQHGGRGLPLEFVKQINIFADIKPDITFFIDIDLETSLKRIQDHDRLDLEGPKFYEKVYKIYKNLISEHKKRIVVIDGNRTIEEIHEEIVSYSKQQ